MMAFFLNLIYFICYVLLALATYDISTKIPDLDILVPYPILFALVVFFAGLAGHLAVLYINIQSGASSHQASSRDQQSASYQTRQEPQLIASRKAGVSLSASLSPPRSGGESSPLPLGNQSTKEAIIDQTRAAISAGRIDIVIQPVVILPQRKTRFFECMSRIRTAQGEVLDPSQYISLIMQTDLMVAVDNTVLLRCTRLARHMHRRQRGLGFFCNLSATSLKNKQFIREFLPFLNENHHLSPHLFLEFTQADFMKLSSRDMQYLNTLAARGFRYSIDHISSLDMDPQFLNTRHVKFLKVSIHDLLQRPQDIRKIKTRFSQRGIDLIVDRIETEKDLLQLLDHGIDYGQGFLFGRPRAARENIAAPRRL